MFREAHAIWTGTSYAGEGRMSTPSGILAEATYAFGSLKDAPCTTPCEVFAAAIASCMSIMVAIEMAKVGIRPITVDVYAVVNLDNPGGKWELTGANLEITARTNDTMSNKFEQAVEAAQHSCPITAALKLAPKCKAKLVSMVGSAFV
jgi:osmotically inducible protein OsmC